MVLDWKGVGVAGLITAGVVWYVSRKIGGAAEKAVDGVVAFSRAALFDPASLGKNVTLTEGAKLSQQDYIDRGYLEVLPDGSTRITSAGQKYIETQTRVNQ